MASTTAISLPSLGSRVAQGTASVADGDTVATGLSTVTVFVATAQSSDVVLSARSKAQGNVTMGVFAAGAASASVRDISWLAIDNSKV